MIAIDPETMRDTATLLAHSLTRLAKEQTQDVASEAAARNIYANVGYLRVILGDAAAIELLGEIREKLIADAMSSARGNG